MSSPVRVLPAPRQLRAAQQSCQDMTCHLLTTLQLQSSSHASSRHHPSCHDPRRRRLARQGPDCKVTITMSASSIAQRQTCCQATASRSTIMIRQRVSGLDFDLEVERFMASPPCYLLGHGHSARGTGHILVGEVQCSRESQIYVHFFILTLHEYLNICYIEYVTCVT